jgi:L-asparaginase
MAPSRSRVCLIDAGGTIAQVRKGTTLSYDDNPQALAFLTDSERRALEQLGLADAVHLFAKDSTDIAPADWGVIAQAIVDRLDDFDGFVVSHGTDTMAYTSSVLSWMLGPVNKPIIITGAQIPMRDEASNGRTDGWPNLVNAVVAAGDGRIREVAVVFGNAILRGNRVTKTSAVELDAYESPNARPLARIGKHVSYAPDYELPEFKLIAPSIPSHWPRIAFVKCVPGLDALWLKESLANGVDGCVLETFLSGSAPPQVMATAWESGIPWLLCLAGNTGISDAYYHESLYWFERGLLVSGRDITREAAYCKLMWALADSRDTGSAVALLKQNLAGEMQTSARPYHP